MGAVKTSKLSVFKLVLVPIFTYGPESWVMTKIILSQEQAAEMGFWRRVHGATLRPVTWGEKPCKFFRPPWKNMLGIIENYWT